MNAIGTQLPDATNLGLTRWRLTVYVDAVAEMGRNPMSRTRFSLGVGDEQADAGRDGTAEPASREQILRRKRGQGKIYREKYISLFS